MADRYQMVLGDCAGPYLEMEVRGFEALLSAVEVGRARMSKQISGLMLCSNLDRCDYDTDGLTYAESEAISMVQQGQGIAAALEWKAEEEAPVEHVEMGGEA